MIKHKKLALLFLLSTALMAEVDQSIYKDARKAYDNGDYKTSYELFQKLFLQDMGNPEINFYLGRSAFENGDYESAMLAFERSLIANPDNVRTQLEFARSYYKLEMKNEARLEFTKILENKQLPQEVRNTVVKYIQMIDDERQKHTLAAIGMVGINYDDNINNLTDYSEFTLPLYNINITRTSEKEKDLSLTELLMLNHNYDFGAEGGYGWQNSLIMMNQNWDKNPSKDVIYGAFSTGPTYRYGKHSFNTAFMVEKLWYGHDPLMLMYDVYPQYTYIGIKDWVLGTNVKYQKKLYVQSGDKEKDSAYWQWEGKAQYSLNKKNALSGSLKLSRERKDRGDNTTVDNDAYTIKAAHTYLWSDTFNINTAYTFQNKDYSDETALFQNKRQDEKHNLALTLTQQVADRTSVIGTVGMTDNRSNQASNTYKKTTAALNLMYIF